MTTATAEAANSLTHDCQVLGVTPLSADTFHVELQSPIGTQLSYRAGQHLQLELDVNGDGELHSLLYSIANRSTSDQPRRLELFIQKNSEFAGKILSRLSHQKDNNEPMVVKVPMGNAFLQTDLNLPHLLVAAGSGIAKIKPIVEEIISQNPQAHIHIYWSNRKQDDFYLLDLFHSWSEQYPHVCFTPILETPDPQWSGRTGYLYQVIQDDLDDLHNTQAYLCGSPRMVYGTIDQLSPLGLQETNCYSDVFEYAPR